MQQVANTVFGEISVSPLTNTQMYRMLAWLNGGKAMGGKWPHAVYTECRQALAALSVLQQRQVMQTVAVRIAANWPNRDIPFKG